MRQNFDKIIEEVLRSEGGYVDHPKDPGGATNRGITRRTLADWRGISPYTALTKNEVKNLSKAEAIRIYKALYWDKVSADDLPSGLDYAVFDFCVHSGPARAIIGLQRLLGVADDGVIGPITLKAIDEIKDLKTFINRYLDDRLRFMKSLSNWRTFGKGWTSRIEKVRKISLELFTVIPSKPKGNEKSASWAALIPIIITILTAIFGALKR